MEASENTGVEHVVVLGAGAIGSFYGALLSSARGLAKLVTESVGAITIGIGAGIHCDGQVLVINDMLGMDTSFKPKHVKRYACLAETVREDANKFIEDVRNGRFPDDAHSFH